MNVTDINVDALLKRLHFANARRSWRDMISRAEKEAWSCRDFLAVLVAEEVAHRQQTRIQRLSSRGGFPLLKTVDDFDFTYQSTVKLALLGSALSPDFVTDGRSLILHGKSGRGKTTSLSPSATARSSGFDTHFVTAAELIENLSVASRDGRLAESLGRYVAPHVLVVDEVGYLTYSHDAANVLCHVVTKRHQAKRSMIFTSNKHPDAWGSVLHDNDLAAAIVDRVLERDRLLHLDGPSMRTKHLGLDAPAHADAGSQQVVRVSGTSSSEFPELTPVPTARELVSLVQASQELFSKLIALCAARSTAESVSPAAAQLKPMYLSEDEVAEMTSMSPEWFQRARREKIGPRWINIARNVRYPLTDVLRWIESGDAAREHVSSRKGKKKTSSNAASREAPANGGTDPAR